MNGAKKTPEVKKESPDATRGRRHVDYKTVPFGCRICNRGFSSMHSLNAHSFQNHRISAKVLVTSGQGKAPSETFRQGGATFKVGGLGRRKVPLQQQRSTLRSSSVDESASGNSGHPRASKKQKLTPTTVGETVEATGCALDRRDAATSSPTFGGNEEEPDAGMGLITDPELKVLVNKCDELEVAVTEQECKLKEMAATEELRKQELGDLRNRAKRLLRVAQAKITLQSDCTENGTPNATQSQDQAVVDIGDDDIKVEEEPCETGQSEQEQGKGEYDSTITSPNGPLDDEKAGPSTSASAKDKFKSSANKNILEDLKPIVDQLLSKTFKDFNSAKPEEQFAEVFSWTTKFQKDLKKDLQNLVLGQLNITKTKIREQIQAFEEKQVGLKVKTQDQSNKLEKLNDEIRKMNNFVHNLEMACKAMKE